MQSEAIARYYFDNETIATHPGIMKNVTKIQKQEGRSLKMVERVGFSRAMYQYPCMAVSRGTNQK